MDNKVLKGLDKIRYYRNVVADVIEQGEGDESDKEFVENCDKILNDTPAFIALDMCLYCLELFGKGKTNE